MNIFFKENFQADPLSLFEAHRTAFSLGDDDALTNYRTTTDQLGFTHYRFQQYYRGLPVESAIFIVHAKNGKPVSANGQTVQGLTLEVSVNITAEEAIAHALSAVNASKYSWEDPMLEQALKEMAGNDQATYYPHTELLIARLTADPDFSPTNFVLAYWVEVYASDPFSAYDVYVNAKTANILKINPRFFHASGSACTRYNYDPVSIETEYVNGSGYKLVDNTRGYGIVTESWDGNGTYFDLYDSDNDWNCSDQTSLNYYGPYEHNISTSVHWATAVTYDYFLNAFGLNSYDGNGSEMRSHVGYTDRASWHIGPSGLGGTDVAHFGTGLTSWTGDWFVSIDVVGHEWSHGVSYYSAGLENTPGSQSLILAESFSDIFGTMVEFYAENLYDPNKSGDWLQGEDFWELLDDGYARSLADPMSKNHPDTYNSTNYYATSGPHERGGVQNYWFYLLSEGGCGINERGDHYFVKPIGKTKAAQIAFRPLTVYLGPTSGFLDAREKSILAAEDLYGVCSNEVFAVKQAWDAVGVYEAVTSIPAGVVVTTGSIQTINTDQIVNGNIYIENDAEMIIDGATVEMEPQSAIIIKQGGRLTLNNGAVLTGLNSCNSMWEGIIVLGNPNQPHPSNLTNNPHGLLVSVQNAVIEHAHVGVRSGKPDGSEGGGMVLVGGTTLRNNRYGMVFEPYEFDNKSFVSFNSFSNTQPLRDEKYDNEGHDAFVVINGGHALNFVANDFTNTGGSFDIVEPDIGPIKLNQRGTGIRAYMSEFSFDVKGFYWFTNLLNPSSFGLIKPNYFEGLSKGIDIYTIGGINNSVVIEGNEFVDVTRGITINGNVYCEVINNSFVISDVTVDGNSIAASLLALANNPYGVYMYDAPGFLISENAFKAKGKGLVIGAISRNAFGIDSRIYKNTFTGIPWVGTQAEENNDQLQIGCNFYENNTIDWLVPSGTLEEQGNCTTVGQENPAGNDFHSGCKANNQILSSVAFNYHHHSNDIYYPTVKPTCVTANVLLTDCGIFKKDSDCKSLLSLAKGKKKIGYLQALLDKIKDPVGKRRLLNSLVQAHIENRDIKAAINILQQMNTEAANKVLVPTFLNEKQFGECRQTLLKIPANTIENTHFQNLFSVLVNFCEQGGVLHQLGENEMKIIREVAASETSVAVQAQTLIAMNTNAQYNRNPDQWPETQKVVENEESEETFTPKQINFKVFPNPAKELIIIESHLLNRNQTVMFTLYDVMGRKIGEHRIAPTTKKVYINISHINNGLYFYQLSINNVIEDQGKLTVIK